MGTHPIFESDFDCLTVQRKKMRVSLARAGIRQGTFSNHHIKGIAKYQISSYEGTAFKEQMNGAYMARSMRRFTESWYKWVPVIGAYYGIMAWCDEYEHHEGRKNPPILSMMSKKRQ